jgi:V/A-type H+/Na+-transporting ATPase subunit I
VFSPVAMKRLSVVVLERDARPVLRALGRLGVVHLVKTAASPETAPLPPADRSKELALAESLLSRIEALREGLGLPEFAHGAAEGGEIAISYAQDILHPIETRINDLLAQRQDVEQRLAGVGDLLGHIEAFQALDIPLDWIGESPFMHFAVGRLPAEKLEGVRSQLAANVLVMPMPAQAGHVPLVAITTHAGGADLDAALKEAGFEIEPIPAKEGATTASLSADSREEQEWLRQELEQAAVHIQSEAGQSGPHLETLWRQVTVERQILEAEQNFPRTEQTSLVTGWVPAPDAAAVQRDLGAAVGNRFALTFSDPGDMPESEIPVLLRHSWFVRPFIALVNMYGLPTYYEVEPAIFVAISYILMFGLMFGDAGNGLVVALVGVGLMIKARTQNLKDAGLVLLLAGLSGIGFGIYYGSYFGIEEWNGQPLGHSPLGPDAMNLMLGAVGVGVLLMSVGLVLQIVNRLRHGNIIDAVMDKFGIAGAVFYWGAIALIVFAAVAGGASVPVWLVVGVIVVPLLAVGAREPLHLILAKRHGHGAAHAAPMSETLIVAVIEIFETVIGFLANTISFVRLAAFAIAHAAVLMASFTIAEELHKGLGGIGLVLGIIVIILGNLVAIVLEGLVAFVQALRLEYYEFFGKFFSGAGRPFKPFRLHGKENGQTT